MCWQTVQEELWTFAGEILPDNDLLPLPTKPASLGSAAVGKAARRMLPLAALETQSRMACVCVISETQNTLGALELVGVAEPVLLSLGQMNLFRLALILRAHMMKHLTIAEIL